MSDDLPDPLRAELAPDETVAWHARPREQFYHALLAGGLLGVWLVGFVGVFLLGGTVLVAVAGQRVGRYLMVGSMLVVLVGGGLGTYLLVRGWYDRAAYAVTDRRVLQSGGVGSPSVATLSWDQVEAIRRGDRELYFFDEEPSASPWLWSSARLGFRQLPKSEVQEAYREARDQRPDEPARPSSGDHTEDEQTVDRADLSSPVRETLDPEEQIRWRGCPGDAYRRETLLRGPLIAGGGLAFLAAMVAGLAATTVGLPVGVVPTAVVVLVASGGLAVATALAQQRYVDHLEYVATDRRLIRCGGTMSPSCESLDWEDVVEVRHVGNHVGVYDHDPSEKTVIHRDYPPPTMELPSPADSGDACERIRRLHEEQSRRAT